MNKFTLSLVIGHLSFVIGHWSFVIGHWSFRQGGFSDIRVGKKNDSSETRPYNSPISPISP
ncbi:hypothetical protein [Coleofasciculus sp. E2-BRE-01]|uniref:hypothetical protein n=1 Tax=Coleofasciculus sp. E2-BRE-01 TaxID=3069524 RepID=UPI0032F63A4E